jgi:thiamine-phosphate pyrophosphorylase
MKTAFPYQLYLVLSEQSCTQHHYLYVAEQAILGGVDIVQLREKNATTAQFIEKALRLQDVLSKHNVPLIINDHLEVAQQVHAHGIHVGNKDVSPSLIHSVWKECRSIGYSIEYLEQLQNDAAKRADCLGVSPVFNSVTKTDTVQQWGLDGIRKIRALTDKPLIAIGNMNVSNTCEVIKAGADCIAVVSAICGAQDPMKAALEIKNQIEKAI